MSAKLRKLLRPTGQPVKNTGKKGLSSNGGSAAGSSKGRLPKLREGSSPTQKGEKNGAVSNNSVLGGGGSESTGKTGRIDDGVESITGTRIKELDDSLQSYLQNKYKILVRNDVTFISRHPREVAIEKTMRMRNVSTLGFLSDRHSAYKSLGK